MNQEDNSQVRLIKKKLREDNLVEKGKDGTVYGIPLEKFDLSDVAYAIIGYAFKELEAQFIDDKTYPICDWCEEEIMISRAMHIQCHEECHHEECSKNDPKENMRNA